MPDFSPTNNIKFILLTILITAQYESYCMTLSVSVSATLSAGASANLEENKRNDGTNGRVFWTGDGLKSS